MTPTNRLINEKSPYLLQHAHNPVDWYAWGSEAFEKARQDDKPILVSIGYSTCHWCHVMEKESYEDPAVAALMNHYMVNIKVDREERPDVDKIYMTAVSAMTGQGGWPLNVFLTPDLKPIFGGTYFPPTSRWGQPAWKDVVTQVGQSWLEKESRTKMLEAASNITEALNKYTTVSQDPTEVDASTLDKGYQTLKASYDPVHGGFGPAPKFPMPVYHNFLLRYYARSKNREALDISLQTLRAMAHGGIYDHLGGGFARYSTDERWHVPHFEKMLYDNAQLTTNYLEAYQITRDNDLKRVAEETLHYIQRDMTHPEGGFFSAEDADSLVSKEEAEKREGAFYVWTQKEILEILGQDEGIRFCAAYGVKAEGNALSDPHGEFTGQNILYVAASGSSQDEATFAEARKKLFAVREKRPRPHLDDKVISGWNGLMISAFAKGHQVLGDNAFLESAQRAAKFLKKNLYDATTGILYRHWRDGERPAKGIADDYAFAAQALIDLYEADFNPDWLTWAVELTETLIKRFADPEKGGFYMTAPDQDEHLLLRIKETMDNVEPSASSVAALNLLRLAHYTDRHDFEEMALKTIKSFGSALKEFPRALPQMLVALDYALTDPRQIVIAGNGLAPDTQAMLRVLHEAFIPVKAIILADSGPVQSYFAQRLSFVKDMKPLAGKATAYVCVHRSCKQPTDDLKVYETLLHSL